MYCISFTEVLNKSAEITEEYNYRSKEKKTNFDQNSFDLIFEFKTVS